ncbi:hypothetical protein B1759_10195 [Rubrivirga sp. SAORIC476]|nr:hypothetical protein B1759_10195 [Rubrivirga sp. SAORIC476]
MIAGCGPRHPLGSRDLGDITPGAEAYLVRALTILQEEALHADRLNAEALDAVADLARNADSPAETYPAIRHAVEALGDGHSAFVTADQVAAGRSASRAEQGPPVDGRSVGSVAVLRLGTAIYDDPERRSGLAEAIHGALAQLADDEPCGWVLDLRGNQGGDLWPMLAGTGPLVGEGEAGGIDVPGPSDMGWRYAGGKVSLRLRLAGILPLSAPQLTVESPVVLDGTPPVAVLTDSLTASSAEALVVAFRGRPRSASFGSPTYGVPTANQTVRLDDGALLIVTTGVFVDRTGRRYAGPIAPDVDAEGPAVLESAIRWVEAECDA